MKRVRRAESFLLAGALLLALGTPALAQGPIQPPATTYLQTWPLTITPNDVAPDPSSGNMAVVDAGNSVIQLLRPGGTNLGQIRGLRDPRCAEFTLSGILLVGEAGTGSVKGYNLSGGVMLTLGSPTGEFQTPNDIAVHPNGLTAYVVDSAADSVKAYSLSDGSHLFSFGATGTGDGQFRFPVSATVNASTGEVYVGDSRNRRIVVFDGASGSFLRNIGVAGGGGGEIAFIGGLHSDPNQRLYVVESLGGFVNLLDPSGGFMAQIGDRGSGPAMLRSPKGVAVDRYNRLLVTSFLDKKIEVWGLDTYENPVDQDLVARVMAIPKRLTARRTLVTVTLSVPGFDPAFLDPDSIRINGIIRPIHNAVGLMGPHLVVKFERDQIMGAIPQGSGRRITLPLNGKTYQGLRFVGEIELVVVAPQMTFEKRKEDFPRRWRYRR